MSDARGVSGVVLRSRVSVVGLFVVLVLRVFVKPVNWLWAAMPSLPWPYGLFDWVAAVLRPVRGTKRTPVRLPAARAEWMTPPGGPDSPATATTAILYLHGGGFILGGLRSHRRLVSRIVTATGLPSLAVDYRMLPRHTVTDAVEDCLDGLRHLVGAGVPIGRIAVVGDSAGGYLAAQVALVAARRGPGRVGAVSLLSPLLDLDPRSKLAAAQGGPADPVFSKSVFVTLWRIINRVESGPSALAELRSVITAADDELAGLPPVLVQVGSGELLRPDSDRFVQRIREAGGDATLEVFADQCHVFQAGADLIPEARDAIDSLAGHLVGALAPASRDEAA